VLRILRGARDFPRPSRGAGGNSEIHYAINSPETSSMPDGSAPDSRFIAYLALAASARLPAAEIAARLGAAGHPAEATQGPDGGAVLRIDGLALMLAWVDAPLPAEVFSDDPHQRAWAGWREAASAQRAHVILANLDRPADAAGALRAAGAVSRLAAALAGLLPGVLGVYWAPSAPFVAPADWRAAAARMTPEAPPVELWVKPRWFRVGEAPAVLTQGLAPFAGREVEHGPSGEGMGEVYGRTMNLALYLLRAGPVLRAGDTVGQTPTQRIAVEEDERGGVPVWRLAFTPNAVGG
jgi:hypothetical protein